MTTAIANVPAHIAARIAARKQSDTKSAVAAAVLGSGDFAYPKISTKGSRYRLVEDGVETPVGVTLDVIVVGANPNVSKIFYSKPYDGSADVRPDCFSNDGVRPDSAVASPVCDTCSLCPNNVLGSKVTPSGAKSKICSDQRHLAVVPAADPTKVYGITIPVSGMKGLREYFKELQNFGVNPEEAITELGFDDNASYPKITFSQKGFVPEKAMDKLDALMNSEDVKVVTRALPSSSAPALSAPKPAPAPAPAAEIVVEAAKPAKPAKEKATPVANKAGLEEIEKKLDSLFG